MSDNNSLFDPIESDHFEEGEALDGEAIISIRPQIEEYVRLHFGEFDRSELYWNLKDKNNSKGPFVYRIHFFKEKKDAPDVQGPDL